MRMDHRTSGTSASGTFQTVTKTLRTIVIYDRRTDTDHQVLEARVTDSGDLVLEGHDLKHAYAVALTG